MIHLKRVKTVLFVLVLRFLTGSKVLFAPQGSEFIQFLQHEYLPSLQVTPEISQVGQNQSRGSAQILVLVLIAILVLIQELCQVLQQPDVKVLKNYMKVGGVLTRFWCCWASCDGSVCLQAFFQRAKL